MLAAAATIAAFAYLRLRDPVFLLTIAWAAAGVALKAGQRPSVSVPAMILCGLAGLGAIGLMLGRTRGLAPQSTMR
jgi:nucleoside permease NupC